MKKGLALVLGLLTLGVLGAIGLMAYRWKSQAYAPEQPIAFSHKLHAGELKLACTHCHLYAEKGPQATAPPLQVCMTCHKTVATDKPGIQKLTHYWNEKKPLAWIKVHHLPWHVRFVHSAHLRRGFRCQTCHGEVETMMRVRQVSDFSMGWCVTCHRQNQGPTDCWVCHK